MELRLMGKRLSRPHLIDLRNSLEVKGKMLENSLSQLVASAQQQSALTSINPLIANNIYYPLTLQWNFLTYFYKTHGIIQTAIDQPVLDAMRGGPTFTSSELDSDDIKEVEDELEEMNAWEHLIEAKEWARLYGGGAIVINVDQDPKKPLDMNRKIKSMELYPVDRWELQSSTIDSEFFDWNGVRFHRSRILLLTGKRAPRIIRNQLSGWGMSEIERIVEDFNKYIKTSEVLYELLEEAKIDVYRLKNLNTQLASSEGTTMTQNRIALMNSVKNFQKALVLDMEDEYEQKQMTFSGLAEVIKENRIAIASALKMPMTKIFGLSAAGFNSGEDDIENYNAMVESEIRGKMKRPIKTIFQLAAAKVLGGEFDVTVGYKPLRVLSSTDEENIKTSKHNRFMGYYDRGLIDSKELGEISEKEVLLPVETNMAKGLMDPQPEPPQPGASMEGKKATAGNLTEEN